MSAALGKRRRGKAAEEPEAPKIEAPAPEKKLAVPQRPQRPPVDPSLPAEPTSMDLYAEVFPYKTDIAHYKVVISLQEVYSLRFNRTSLRLGNATAYLQLLQFKPDPKQTCLYYFCEGNKTEGVVRMARRGRYEAAAPEPTADDVGIGKNGEIVQDFFDSVEEGIAKFEEAKKILLDQGYQASAVEVLTNRALNTAEVQRKFAQEMNTMSDNDRESAQILLESTDLKSLEEALAHRKLDVQTYKARPIDDFERSLEKAIDCLKEIVKELRKSPEDVSESTLKDYSTKYFKIFPFTLKEAEIQESIIDSGYKVEAQVHFLKVLQQYESVYHLLLTNSVSWNSVKTKLFTKFVLEELECRLNQLAPNDDLRKQVTEAFKKGTMHRPQSEDWVIEDVFALQHPEPIVAEVVAEPEPAAKTKGRGTKKAAAPAANTPHIVAHDQIWWSMVGSHLLFPTLRYGLVESRPDLRTVFSDPSPLGLFETLHELPGNCLDLESHHLENDVVYLIGSTVEAPITEEHTLDQELQLVIAIEKERKMRNKEGGDVGQSFLVKGSCAPDNAQRVQLGAFWSATLDKVVARKDEKNEYFWRKVLSSNPKATKPRFLMRVRLSSKVF